MVISENAVKTIRSFVYEFFPDKNCERRKLTLPINIAEDINIKELASRVTQFHKIPCYLEDELHIKLKHFLREQRIKYSDEKAKEALQALKKKPSHVQKIAKSLAESYQQSWVQYGQFVPQTNEFDDSFSSCFHKLIHSSAMSLLLDLRQHYFRKMSKIVDDSKHSLLSLQDRQEMEMQRICEHVGDVYTKDTVNAMLEKHIAATKKLQDVWKSKLDEVSAKQKSEYHGIVRNLYEEMKKNNDNVDKLGNAYKLGQSIVNASMHNNDLMGSVVEDTFGHGSNQESASGKREKSISPTIASTPMEESFTINLGAQLKTMHNIRLISDDILNFCRHSNDPSDQMAQQLQTVMSLYSNSLSGLLLLGDDCIPDCQSSLIKREFSSICEQSTEFHFASLSEQMETVKEELTQRKLTGDKLSLKSGDSASIDSENGTTEMILEEGDFIVTKHSNLSKVHIVFHVANEPTQLCAPSSTVTSRHPVILGIRHILKVMSSHDIETLTVPLLLTHSLSDDITPSWIHKRADLVMKCIKGFMMEMATWDGGVSRTIQFILPQEISGEAFDQIRKLLPSIFRTTSSVTLKKQPSNQNKHKS